MNLLLLSLDQGMTESESGGGEFVQDAWIKIFVVIFIRTLLKWHQTKFLHFRSTNYDGKPFIVGDVLHLSNQNAPGLLVEALVIPVWIQIGEFRRKPVVFSQENSLRDSQVGGLIRS